MQPETRFKQLFFAMLKEIPHVWYFKVEAGAVRGIPDVIICAGGKFVAVELKVPPNIPTKIQAFTLTRIEKSGGLARVITPDNVDDFVDKLYMMAAASYSTQKS